MHILHIIACRRDVFQIFGDLHGWPRYLTLEANQLAMLQPTRELFMLTITESAALYRLPSIRKVRYPPCTGLQS